MNGLVRGLARPFAARLNFGPGNGRSGVNMELSNCNEPPTDSGGCDHFDSAALCAQSVHYDLVVGQMFAKNSKQKLWFFVLYLFDLKFLKMAPGTHNVATNQINRSHCADRTRW